MCHVPVPESGQSDSQSLVGGPMRHLDEFATATTLARALQAPELEPTTHSCYPPIRTLPMAKTRAKNANTHPGLRAKGDPGELAESTAKC